LSFLCRNIKIQGEFAALGGVIMGSEEKLGRERDEGGA
jgi:hypothetical protein